MERVEQKYPPPLAHSRPVLYFRYAFGAVSSWRGAPQRLSRNLFTSWQQQQQFGVNSGSDGGFHLPASDVVLPPSDAATADTAHNDDFLLRGSPAVVARTHRKLNVSSTAILQQQPTASERQAERSEQATVVTACGPHSTGRANGRGSDLSFAGHVLFASHSVRQ